MTSRSIVSFSRRSISIQTPVDEDRPPGRRRSARGRAAGAGTPSRSRAGRSRATRAGGHGRAPRRRAGRRRASGSATAPRPRGELGDQRGHVAQLREPAETHERRDRRRGSRPSLDHLQGKLPATFERAPTPEPRNAAAASAVAFPTSGNALNGRIGHAPATMAASAGPPNRWETRRWTVAGDSTPASTRGPAGALQPNLRKGPRMPVVSMKELLEAGVHFGHQTRRWNPKMKRFIFTERGGIYIIDLHADAGAARRGAQLRRRRSPSAAASILFVGTKKQAQDAVARRRRRASACRTSTTAGSAACSRTGARSPTASSACTSCAA